MPYPFEPRCNKLHTYLNAPLYYWGHSGAHRALLIEKSVYVPDLSESQKDQVMTPNTAAREQANFPQMAQHWGMESNKVSLPGQCPCNSLPETNDKGWAIKPPPIPHQWLDHENWLACKKQSLQYPAIGPDNHLLHNGQGVLVSSLSDKMILILMKRIT